MPEATFRNGNPTFIDYTPSGGNIAAGQVILYGNTAGLTCLVAHEPITNNTAGAVAACGGIYDVTMLSNLAAGAAAYWDDTNNKLTSTSTNNALFGFVVGGGGGGANATAQVIHYPFI